MNLRRNPHDGEDLSMQKVDVAALPFVPRKRLGDEVGLTCGALRESIR